MSYIGLTAAYGVLIGSESVIESVIYRLGLTVGIVFWYVCATGLKGIPKRLVLSFSKYSFLIYLFHELNLTVLKKLLASLLPLTIPFQIAEYFCVPCIILLFCTGLSILLERIAPGVFVVLNGGRALRYTKNR